MSTDKLKTMDDYFNQFLLSMLNNGNAPLICELKLRWKEFCNTPILNNDTVVEEQVELGKKLFFKYGRKTLSVEFIRKTF